MAKVGAFEAGGKRVACPHCGGVEFRNRNAFWYGKLGADAVMADLVCTTCGRHQQFTRKAVTRLV